MSGRPILPHSSRLTSDQGSPSPAIVPKRRDGKPKSRLSWDEKLQALDPLSPVKVTKSRIKSFTELFASRSDQAIATLVGQGHGKWVTLHRCPLTHKHIGRHLLADRIPTIQPQWFGSRSFFSSPYFCLDVDHKGARAAFRKRCLAAERALRRMGIDPNDPRQVLIQPSPSGGRHYYVFFDGLNPVDEYHHLLRSAGLKHTQGDIEFYPSETHGLRLPFGHIPGEVHDPRAWIQFIDDYDFGRIRLHSLRVLRDRLGRSKWPSPTGKPGREKPSHAKVMARDGRDLGIPKRLSPRISGSRPEDVDAQVQRYMELMENGIKSFRDVRDLERLGIRVAGTRNRALNHLAAHRIWFLHETAEQAADYLLHWSMDERHDSKDIRSDLEKGTSIVSNQLAYMCPWYESHEKTKVAPLPVGDRERHFAPAELNALRLTVLDLPEGDRVSQAHFLLELLSYTKKHGWLAADDSGREAAVAINEVIRKWPGCRGKNIYKKRIDQATEAGILRVVREKWHNHDGPGRPRTYRLNVPIIASEEASVGYDDALAYLAGKSDLDVKSSPSEHDQEKALRSESHEPNPEQSEVGHALGDVHPEPLHPGRPPGSLGQDSHQRNQEPTQAYELPHPSPGVCPTLRGPGGRRLTVKEWKDLLWKKRFDSVDGQSRDAYLARLGRIEGSGLSAAKPGIFPAGNPRRPHVRS